MTGGGGRLFVVAGSTASGKSALAMAMAAATGGTIVNADSQQLFADLPVLTARPGPADTARAPHALYGVLGPREQPSAGRWLELVRPVLEPAVAAERTLVLVGGTGLYIKALLHGLVAAPPVPDRVRAALAAETAGWATAALHRRLAALDPVMAARLRPSDRQRLLRALEVVQATGRSLAAWQADPPVRLALPATVQGLALTPPAAVVAERAAARLSAMLAAGAVAEVAALASLHPDLAALPIGRVHGAREILAHLTGALDRAAVQERVAAQVRQYAKRQRTFLRHQLAELVPVATVGESIREPLELLRRLDPA